MKLVFLVDNQIITRVDKNILISDSNNYVFVQFVFGFLENIKNVYDIAEAIFWRDGETKYVDLDGIDATCRIPDEFLTAGSFKISLLLTNNVESITTNRVVIDVGPSGFENVYKPDVYSKLINRIEKLEKDITHLTSRVDKLEEKAESGDQNDNVGESDSVS